MAVLLFAVLFLQLSSHLVNTIGKQHINDLLWSLTISIPSLASLIIGDASTTANVSEVPKLRREVVRLRTEMNSISAQDDFAKWARVRREHDRVLAECEQKASLLTSTRSSFDTKASVLRWLATSGARFLLQFWFAKVAVFTLPPSWLPWPVEWVLGFPRCPYGGVSVNVWGMACGVVVALVVDGLASLAGLGQGQGQGQTEKGDKATDKSQAKKPVPAT